MWLSVVWCGVVWCGVVWFGVVWCGLVWRGVVWFGVACVVVWGCFGDTLFYFVLEKKTTINTHIQHSRQSQGCSHYHHQRL